MRLNSGVAESSSTGALLALHAEQACRIAAQNGDLVFVAQRRSREYMIDRMPLPRNRMVAADDDLARTDLRHQVAERFRREYECIEIELFEIVARRLLQLDVRLAILGGGAARMGAAPALGAEVAAT